MIKNEYTNRINEIKAPQSAVENAVKAALEADKNKKEVITMPKKPKIIKIVSAAAACILVAVGVVIYTATIKEKTTIQNSDNESKIVSSVQDKNVKDNESKSEETIDKPHDFITPSDYVVEQLENTRSELERNVYVLTATYPDITQEQLDEILLAIEEAFPVSPDYKKAVIMGRIDPKSKLTLEGTKQIIADALAQVEDESELSNYLFTVPEYIKNKIDEIQPIPNFCSGSGVYSFYYLLDADDFENCHKAIVLVGGTQTVVYKEYDDDHKEIHSEVLYDINPYVQKLR